MKLCVDCMYFIVSSSKCGARLIADPVRGMPFAPPAAVERASIEPEACGFSAKHYRTIPVAVSA